MSQIILYSAGVSCLYFHVVLSEFMMEAILTVILLSVMNVVSRSTSHLIIKMLSPDGTCTKTDALNSVRVPFPLLH